MRGEIHHYDRRIKNLLERIRKSAELDEDSRKLLLDYERDLLLYENLSIPRREKLVGNMFILFRFYFKKPIKTVTLEDIKNTIHTIETKDYSAWTKAAYKVVIRKFYRWLEYGNNGDLKKYPPLVSWIRVHVRKKDRPHVQASDILLPGEVVKFIAAGRYSRDGALGAVLYELGARIDEMGEQDIRHYTQDQYSRLVDIDGKTGHRTPRIVLADPYVTEWLNHHPLKNDPNAPMWVCPDGKGGWKRMDYGALREVIRRMAQRAGITKRVHPHLFRHTRVTHLLNSGQINEAQAKVYFGWTADSGMLSEYAHLVSKDANNAILRLYGFSVNPESMEEMIRRCPRCSKINSNEAKFCIYCSSILDDKTAFKQDGEQRQVDTVLNELMRDSRVQEILKQKIAELGKEKLIALAK